MTTFRLVSLRALLGAFALYVCLPSLAHAGATILGASFDYSLPDRFSVPAPAPEGDVEVYTDQPTHPESWRVDLDACASTGEIEEYRWSVDGSSAGSSASCDAFFHDFASEGDYAVSLTVVDSGGGQATFERTVTVQDWLIFGLGDSYGSGEGNPESAISPANIQLAEAAQSALDAAELARDAAARIEQDARAILSDLEGNGDALLIAVSAYAVARAAYEGASCPGLNPVCVGLGIALNNAEAELDQALADVGLSQLGVDDLDEIPGALAGLLSDAGNELDDAVAALAGAQDAVEAAGDSLDAALADLSPTWQNRRCHRSSLSGQVQAARVLEESDPRSSVTFVHLACSGATIHQGLLGPYSGQENGGPDIAAQVERANQIAGQREVDALVISIGGNDVNFATIIETCMVGEPCHDDPVSDSTALAALVSACAAAGPLAPDCGDFVDEFQVLDAVEVFELHSPSKDELHEDGLDDLPDGYQALADEIDAELALAPGRVYLTEYPDATRDETGAYCGWSTGQSPEEQLEEIPGVSAAEIQWADTWVQTRLGAAMAQAAATHGWTFVEGIAAPFATHGYCANDNWLNRIQESYVAQGDATGSVHPNEKGHRVYRDAIASAVAVPEPGSLAGPGVALLALALIRSRRRR